jgi:hypothetical protein
MYRFRTGEKGELVLQVQTASDRDYYRDNRSTTWRDATVADIPVNDPFVREPREQLTGGSVGDYGLGPIMGSAG